MQFSSIKCNDKAVKMEWTLTTPGGTMAVKLEETQPPLPELPAALQAFAPFVGELLDLPDRWREELVITGLSIDRNGDEGLRGLIVTARRRIEKANGRPVILNTPRMPEAGENTSDNIAVMDDETIALLDEAEKEATRYVNGERAQAELFPNSVADPVAASENGQNGQVEKPHPLAGKPTHRRKRKGKDFVPGVGAVANPDAVIPPTDDELRSVLLTVDRDVPIDAIATWGSIDRDAAFRWASLTQKRLAGQVKPGDVPEEPACVKESATLPLQADEWSSNPPRVDDDAQQQIAAAVESGK